jgi:hypothetical protein
MLAAKARMIDRSVLVGWISVLGYAALCGLVYLVH